MINENPFKVFLLNPLNGHISRNTTILCYPGDLKSNKTL